jgi:hypothetical protein
MPALLPRVNIINLLSDTTSLAAATTSAICDMQGYEGALIVCNHGTNVTDAIPTFDLIAGTSAACQGSTLSRLTAGTTAIDDKLYVFDLYKPTHRYFKVVATGGSSDASEGLGVTVIQYGSKERPITQGTTSVQASTLIVGSSGN